MDSTRFGPGPRVVAEPYFTSSPFEPVTAPIERLEHVDFTDPDLYRTGDPHAAWKMLRDQGPLFWHEKGSPGTHGKGFWISGRHAEFVQVTRTDSRIFSNYDTPLLDMNRDHFGDQISTMDPPRHVGYRRLIQPFLTPKAVARWTGAVRGLVDGMLDEVCERGECDFAEVALKLPGPATAALLCLTEDETANLQSVQEALHHAGSVEELTRYTESGMAYFGQIIADRRAHPRDDLVGAIIKGQPEGEPLTDPQILSYLWILFIGGLDSTVHAITGSLLTLFHHPDQLARLRDDPGLIDTGVEELLRWTTVSQHLKRLATEDTVLGGQKVSAGDFVVVFDPSANRDERHYPDPYRFDVGRTPGNLCTFGHGPHICAGLHLARLELKVLFSKLLRRFPDVAQAGPAVRSPSFSVLLPPIKSLPITFTPGPRVGRRPSVASAAT